MDNEGEDFLKNTYAGKHTDDKAVLINADAKAFKDAIKKHRNWDRMEVADNIPA